MISFAAADASVTPSVAPDTSPSTPDASPSTSVDPLGGPIFVAFSNEPRPRFSIVILLEGSTGPEAIKAFGASSKFIVWVGSVSVFDSSIESNSVVTCPDSSTTTGAEAKKLSIFVAPLTENFMVAICA